MKDIILPFVNSILNSDWALLGLFAVAFAESSFFPIPPDTILIPLSLLNPPLALFYALITTVGSVVGGIAGYFIGRIGGKPIVQRFISDERLYNVRLYYHKYDVWAILIAAFTPIPYKIFTISAGLFDLDFKRFVLASVGGRGGRFFAVGLLIFIFGLQIRSFLTNYFELFIVALTILLIGGFVVANRVLKKSTLPS